MRDGLSNDRVLNIVRAPDGRMWFSTRVGVDRYDGSTVRNYRLYNHPEEYDRIGRNNFVAVSPEGQILAGNARGDLFRYDPVQEHFTLEVRMADSLGVPRLLLTCVAFMDEQRVLIGGAFGLAAYDMKASRVDVLMTGDLVANVERLAQDRYAVASNDGLKILEYGPDGQARFTDVCFGPLHERIQSVLYDARNDVLYAGSFAGNLYKYFFATGKVYKVFATRTPLAIRDLCLKGPLLWIGTDGLGIFTFDTNSSQVREHYPGDGQDGGLCGNAVYDICDDGENRMWVCTYTRGISILDENTPDFDFVLPGGEDGAPLRNNAVNAVMEDHEGNVWYGTDNGVAVWMHKTGKWVELLDNARDLQRYKIMSLCMDRNGDIWAGALARGALCIDRRTLQVKLRLEDVARAAAGEGIPHVYSVYCDSTGCIWAGGLAGRVIRYDPATRNYREYTTQYVNSIGCWQGDVLIGTTSGLFKYDRPSDSFLSWPRARNEGLFRVHVNYIHTDASYVWFSTDLGVVCYRVGADSTSFYTQAEGLPSAIACGITTDSRGNTWISTDQGLACIDAATGKIAGYTSVDGLRDDRFTTRAVMRSRAGELYFGCSYGAIRFDPASIGRHNVSTRLMFSDFRLNYNSIYDDGDGVRQELLSANINDMSTIRLNHRQNTFSFSLAAVNYSYASKILYRWRLEGYDPQWIESSSGADANYASVPHGSYRFTAQAVNREDGQVLDSRTMRVEIDPPFWAALPARILYVLLGLLLVWIVYRLMTGVIERRNSDRMIEYFTQTAHEIKTPLSLIVGPLNKLEEGLTLDPDDRSMLDMAVRNARKLNLMVSRLLDFRKVEMRLSKMVLSPYDLPTYMAAKLDAFRPLAIGKSIDLRMEDRMTDREVWFDGMMMDMIVDNLLSNAIKYTPAGGAVNVTLVQRDKTTWAIEVQDNGIGISKEAQSNLMRNFHRADNAVSSGEEGNGVGLMTCRTLVRILRGRLTFASVLGAGSRFTVTFRYGNAHFKSSPSVIIDSEGKLRTDSFSTMGGEEPAPAARPEQAPVEGGKCVLVAEDNDQLRAFIASSLRGHYNVAEAADGRQALQMVGELIPDLVLTDVMMPLTDGYQLCAGVKAGFETSHIPVIMLTALDDKSQIARGYDAGADDYITKPFDATLLRIKIDRCIQSREALRSRLLDSVGDAAEVVGLGNELDDRFIATLTSYLNQNLQNSEYSINELCRDMAIGRTSFYNKIKALTNQTPNDFIRIFRLNHAARMLREGVHNVNEVAFASGFGDVKYFSTIFKKHYGVSPSKY